MALIIKKKRVKNKGIAVPRDPNKEEVFKNLVSVLERAGILVRREELKRGHGWRAISGFCRHNDSPVVFVDRMLPQDDQIAFLLDQIHGFKISPVNQELEKLPEVIQRQFSTYSSYNRAT